MYDLSDATDVHAHARGHDEEEPLHAAQEASRAGMKAILFKSIARSSVGSRSQPAGRGRPLGRDGRPAAREVPLGLGHRDPLKPVDFGEIKAAVEGGVSGMWMPPVTSAWSIFRLGGRGVWFDKSRRPDDPVPPQAWEAAKKVGVYVLGDHGRLQPAIRDTVRLCADHGVTLSFGHLSPQEMDAMAEECTALGYDRAFIESYRLLAATLRAYGMTEPEMRQLMRRSAEKIVNLN